MALSSPRFSRNNRLQFASENNPPMKTGESSEAVRIVQMALFDLGFTLPVTTKNGTRLADGIFGAETQKTVRTFQTLNGLSPDGIVGRNTLATLQELTVLFSEQRAATDTAEATHRSAMSRVG